jgi:hypothetical protein
MRLPAFRRSRRLLALCRRFVVSYGWIPAFAGMTRRGLERRDAVRASPYCRAGRYRREGRPQPFPSAFRLKRFASTAKARAPHGAANAAPWMAIDADRVEREPIVARPLAPFVPAAPRPTLPGPREPALFVENSDLLGAAEAVRPLPSSRMSTRSPPGRRHAGLRIFPP